MRKLYYLLGALLISFITYGQTDESLAAHYKLNNNAKDAISSSNNGFAKNISYTDDRFGNTNGAAVFNGSSSYIVTPFRQLNDTAITISLWVKTNQSGSGTWIDFRGPYGYNANSRGLTLGYLPYSPYNLKFVANNDNLEIGVSNPNTGVNDNQWHHVAAIWHASTGTSVNKNQFTIYVDGVAQVSNYDLGHNPYSYSSVSPLTGADSLRIGFGKAWSTYFKGAMDDVKIFKKNLSLTEIQTIYKETKPSNCLIAEYELDNNAVDSSPEANDGISYKVSPTSDRNENLNSASLFNGSSSYIATPLKQDKDTAITITLWVKTTQNSAGTWVDFRGPYGYKSSSRGLTLGNLPYAPYNIKFVMNNDDLEIGVSNSNSEVIDGQWHHIAAVWSAPTGTAINKSQFAIYIDGLKQTSTYDLGHNPYNYTSTSPLTGADSLRIGYGTAWNTYFNGSLDDVKIYRCKYSDSDVLNDYNNTKSITTNLDDVNSFNKKLAVVPNPNNGSFKIKNLAFVTEIIIVNTLGETVYNQKVRPETPEIATKLPQGIYIIKSLSDSQPLSEKLVIE